MRNRYTVLFLSATLLSSTAYTANAMNTVSGGVGEGGEFAIEQVQENYNLKLVFTGDQGMYLSNVNVVIRDREGDEVVQGVTNGPMLLAELQPGRYTVEANAEGFSQKRNITVGNNLKTYQVSFPIKDEYVSAPAERMQQSSLDSRLTTNY